MLVWVPDIQGALLHQIDFFIPGRPRAWKRGIPFIAGRGIAARAKIRDDDRNLVYKPIVRHHFMRVVSKLGIADIFPWRGVARLTVHALFKPGKSVAHWPGREHIQDPDCTNIGKLIEDSLFMPNSYKAAGARIPAEDRDVLWALIDDHQEVQVILTKQWYETDGVVVKLELFDEVPKPRRPHAKISRPGK